MKDTVIQVPITKELRRKAEKAAEKAGFSSVQELVRVFLKEFVSGQVELEFVEKGEK